MVEGADRVLLADVEGGEDGGERAGMVVPVEVEELEPTGLVLLFEIRIQDDPPAREPVSFIGQEIQKIARDVEYLQ